MKVYVPTTVGFNPSYADALRHAIELVGHAHIAPWSDNAPTDAVQAARLIELALSESDIILMPLYGCMGLPFALDGGHTRWSADLEFDLASDSVRGSKGRTLYLFQPAAGFERYQPRDGEAAAWLALKNRIKKEPFTCEKFQRPADLKVKVLGCLLRAAGGVPSTVLISSTYWDLELVRGMVEDALDALRFDKRSIEIILHNRLNAIQRFENQPPSGASGLESSEALVRGSLLYFGILGSRYGTVVSDPRAAGRSLTHFEYELACKLGKPRVFLVAPENCGLDPGEDICECQANQEKLKEFKRQVHTNEERVAELPMPPGQEGETIMLRTLDLMSWLAQPARDEPARPPAEANSRYVAHEYALLDEGRSVARTTVKGMLEGWWKESFTGGPRGFMLTAMGGMGKSAIAWDWFSDLTDPSRPGPTHPTSMWWSFYAADSTVGAFARYALAWLTNAVVDPTAADPAVALIRELSNRPGQNVLFVLDGAERILRFYNENEAAARFEGVLLEHALEDAAVRLSISDQFENQPDPVAAARQSLLNLREEDAKLLLKLLELPNVRLLVTTRFPPTQIHDLSRTANPMVVTYPLLGLLPTEVRFLWEDMGLVWEDGLPQGCSGTFEDICCRSLLGYALPITILGRLVKSSPGAGGRFSRWKEITESERSVDYFNIQPGDAPVQATGVSGARPPSDDSGLSNLSGPKLPGPSRPSQDPAQVACDRLTERIVSLARQSLSVDEQTLLARIQESGVPILLATLLQDQVKPDGQFESASVLWRALNRLRDLKLVGRSRSSWSYEMHPLVRSAAIRLSAATAEDLQQVEELERIGKLFAAGAEGADIDAASNSIFRTINQLLRENRIRLAARLFVDHVEPVLRFKHDRSVTRVREKWSSQFDAELSWFAEMASTAVVRGEIRQLQLRVRALRMDNEFLLGRITRGLDLLGFSDKEVPKPIQGESAVLYNLNRADLLISNLRLYEAERWLRFAYHAVSRSRSKMEDSALPVWVCRALGEVWLMLGRIDWARWAREECDRHVNSPPNADAEYLSFLIAREGGDVELALSIRRFEEAVERGKLGYGRVALQIMKTESAIGQSQFAEAELKANEALSLATRGEFKENQRRCRILLAKALLGQGRATDAVNIARSVVQESHADGDAKSECRALLIEARALHVSGNISGACERATDALRCAWGEGEPYCWKTKCDEARALIATWGCEAPDLAPSSRPPLSTVRRNLSPAVTISNTSDWTEEQVAKRLKQVKEESLGWLETKGSAEKWWLAFESENSTRTKLVVRLAEEIAMRNATITEFFVAYLYSNVDNIQANLDYLDYTRRRKLVEQVEGRVGCRGAEADHLWGDLIDWARGKHPGLAVLSDDELNAFAAFQVDQLTSHVGAIIQPEDTDVAQAAFRTWFDLFPLVAQIMLAEILVGMKASAGEVARIRDQIKLDDPLAILSYMRYDRFRLKQAGGGSAAEPPIEVHAD